MKSRIVRPGAPKAASAGASARTLAPPAYGIDFVDRGQDGSGAHVAWHIVQKRRAQPKPVLQLVKRKGTITVDPERHPDASDRISASEDYRVGFKMPVRLEVDPEYADKASNALDFRQFARDAYVVDGADGKRTNKVSRKWALDQYGFDKAKGDWDSDRTAIWWTDEPGWTGNNDNVLEAGQQLSSYKVSFYWTVKEHKGEQLHKTAPITLTATAAGGDIKYDVKDQKVNDGFSYGTADAGGRHSDRKRKAKTRDE